MTDRSVESLLPLDTPTYMLPAWLGCISFAMKEPGTLEQFRADTGLLWEPGRTGLEREIDKVTGADWAFIKAFIEWVNVNVWGPVDGPDDEDEAA